MKTNINEMGSIICKGTGLKSYFQMKLSKEVNGVTEYKTFTYEVGNIQQILTEVNRQSSWNYATGRKNPVAVNRGLRSIYGTITFGQLDAGMINALLKDVKKWNAEKTGLIDAQKDLDNFSFDIFSFKEQDAPLLGGAKEELDFNIYSDEPIMLDDLPPVDIIVIGNGSQIDPEIGEFGRYKRYEFKCLKTTFLSETFGISAGAPLHNVATKCLFLGGVEAWHEVEGLPDEQK